MTSTEHNTYGPGHAVAHVKHHEWRTAENSAAHLVPHLKSAVAQNPKPRLLDVGAGSGTITASLAKHMPEGEVVATDISDDILARAKAYADAQGLGNITFQKASIYELPFADGFFDVTHAHQVLTHLDSPIDAIREMLRVTKPGGLLSLREVDMAMWCWWPDSPALGQFQQVMAKSQTAYGGCGTAGRQLLSWAIQAGAKRDDIDFGFGTWCLSSPSDRGPWGKSNFFFFFFPLRLAFLFSLILMISSFNWP